MNGCNGDFLIDFTFATLISQCLRILWLQGGISLS